MKTNNFISLIPPIPSDEKNLEFWGEEIEEEWEKNDWVEICECYDYWRDSWENDYLEYYKKINNKKVG